MADFLASKIDVDAARGSGHAMGASMRSMPSHLRTRIAADGMDYKGYNIAVHEFGHNVEQTISNHFVDNYFINGVPNTAFTEAIAFMFQKRDLQLLGIEQADPMMEHLDVLDIFWDNYEMMGVSLVDMEVWKWLYDNPDATAQQLKEAVTRIAKEIWNEYYADVFGIEDTPILAIYSHMIQSPLYLMNYPYGRLIMFQLEDYMADKDFADEIMRIYSLGQLTPRHWMKRAVGSQISNEPIFAAVEKALLVVKE
jgi:oligoendopeptidase F